MAISLTCANTKESIATLYNYILPAEDLSDLASLNRNCIHYPAIVSNNLLPDPQRQDSALDIRLVFR